MVCGFVNYFLFVWVFFVLGFFLWLYNRVVNYMLTPCFSTNRYMQLCNFSKNASTS